MAEPITTTLFGATAAEAGAAASLAAMESTLAATGSLAAANAAGATALSAATAAGGTAGLIGTGGSMSLAGGLTLGGLGLSGLQAVNSASQQKADAKANQVYQELDLETKKLDAAERLARENASRNAIYNAMGVDATSGSALQVQQAAATDAQNYMRRADTGIAVNMSNLQRGKSQANSSMYGGIAQSLFAGFGNMTMPTRWR
jgi:hypothetical protein